jgi:probable F420-dependent oxidoreductase
MQRPFRFGFQITDNRSDPIAAACRAEEIGFDVVLAPDHVGPGWSPLPTLAAIAAATSRIRLGTLVLNVAMRNPVQLAWEATTLDRLSAGRFELGLGAGHTPHEFAETGIELSPARVRKADLAEQVEIIRRLLDGETVDHDGTHHTITGAHVGRAEQLRLPILVGGNGAALLGQAGAFADIIGLQGLGRTLPDGHSHEANWSTEHLDTQVQQIRAGAGNRFEDIELNALVQFVAVTHDAEAVTSEVCSHDPTLERRDVADSPYILIGTVDEIVDKLCVARERWGITYFAVRNLDSFAAVIAAARGR